MLNKINNNFLNGAIIFLKKWRWVLFFVVLAGSLSKALVSAQQEIPAEEKILQKLEVVLETQSKLQDSLNTVLSNQEEIKKELEIVKIRASSR